jgi:signal peptidase I
VFKPPRDQRDPAVLTPAAGDPDATVPDSDAPGSGRRKKSWRQLMMIVVAAIVLMLIIKAFVVQVYRIPSSSMEDTLLTSDRVLVNKLVYHVRGIARGDIVVFSGDGSWGTITGEPDPSPPGNPLLRVAYDVLADVGVYSTQTYYIKRVIGLPGDHVVCCVGGKVTVNGVPLNEASYLFPGASPSMQRFSAVVPRGRLWVMGDNRAISDDSRGHKADGFPAMGTIPENEVAGRAFMIIWPPSQIGDLPIPATFQQAALHADAAAAMTAVPAVVPVAGATVLVGIPVLALRTRRTLRTRRVRAGRRGRPRGCAGARR